MPPSREEQVKRLVELVERIAERMRSRPLADWADMEMTMPQCRIMGLLYEGPQRMGSIAAHLDSSLPAASGMVERLVEKGLVNRVTDPADRRAVVCELTPKGISELERFWQFNRETIADIAKHLSDAELPQVLTGVELFYEAAQRAAASFGSPSETQ